jgi:hypothetical protein
MDPRIRASDADREHTVERLREQVGTGRLSLEEFSERTADAYQARTVGELAALTRDLPVPAPAAAVRHVPVPVLAVVAALVAFAAFLLAGVTAADSMGPMMDHMSSMHH